MSSRAATILSTLLLVWAFAGACTTPSGSEVDAGTDADADADRSTDSDIVRDDGAPRDADAADGLDGSTDADTDADTDIPDCRATLDRPLRIFFIGNSFTLGGPIPDLVQELAVSAGWPEPVVEMSAVGGYTLERHRELSSTLEGVATAGWDFVVIQEYSTRPTDNIGNPERFKEDVTWFYDQIKASSAGAMIVLYETWARHPDHAVYPGSFADASEMQAQLRFHYHDAAESYVPAHATFTVPDDVVVAPVGDAWENHLAEADAVRLHGSDDYHAGSAGQYLNALVIYSTIYGCRSVGLADLGRPGADAARLQASADATTGEAGVPPADRVEPLLPGETVLLDCGEEVTAASGWNNLTSPSGSVTNALTSDGEPRALDFVVTDGFAGSNASGVEVNELGYPTTVSVDLLWTGSFDGHTEGLGAPAQLTIGDLAPGSYRIELFASRTGDDGGLGRLTRYTVDGIWHDLEVADNRGALAVFEGASPDSDGEIVLDIEVSPAGSGRFAYLGALIITRQE